MDVLVLGARGGLGRLVASELVLRGHNILTVPRDQARDPKALAATGAQAIVNCAGASVALGFGHGWRGYRAVDTPIGLAAAAAARQLDVRLVYVSVHHSPAFANCWYVDAHEQVARAMRDVDGVVVRPTGFFSAFASLIPLARRGILLDIGDGKILTNPIDEHDLAAIVAESIAGDGPRDIACGGPQILSRRSIFELVAAAAGAPNARVRGMPVWLARLGSAALCAVHPRMGQFARFATLLAQHDMIGPALGTMTLERYFQTPRPAEAVSLSA
jgi:divinyl chlorophyllide a 8-vinyl-reductase